MEYPNRIYHPDNPPNTFYRNPADTTLYIEMYGVVVPYILTKADLNAATEELSWYEGNSYSKFSASRIKFLNEHIKVLKAQQLIGV